MAMLPIPVIVEIEINGVWVNITQFVYQRDPIAITGGQTDEQDTVQPATCTMTVNNRDGRFSPNYPYGTYYPYLKQNVQLRVSVSGAVSSSGNTYTGYRFWGEVSTWPPLQDISGHDVYVSLTASGPLRRITTGGGKGSALARYYAALTGDFAPIAYWPVEEGTTAGLCGCGVIDGVDMIVTGGPPVWKAVSDFNGSQPIGIINKSTWTGISGALAATGDDVYDAPGTYQWVASTTSVDAIAFGAGGGGGASAGAGGGGGGGEYAEEATLAVTPGNTYTIVVGAPGQGSANGGPYSTDGQDTTIQGNSVTVTANGGSRGTSAAGGAGGTGSGNTIHHPGGAGFYNNVVGGGGGSSGGPSASGNSATGASGADAVAGGGNGGDGGGATVQNYTTTYNCIGSWSYQGSDGHQPNTRINYSGIMYHCGDNADTYNGKAKSFILFGSAIQGDLSGATVKKVELYLNNNHSWYNDYMTVGVGYTNQTSYGTSHADPSGGTVDMVERNYNEGQAKWITIDATGASFGAAFKSGAARSIILFVNTNNLRYYGYFAGYTQSGAPKLRITYTK